ncbi:MAG: D-2-hydroxyacid dehydrogenase [Firmicutes bacterium]|nr:D-2-hydroxyacid dehydrogenase [Bacillota bacterium]
MKIVVLDGYTLNPGDLDWHALESLGELQIYDRTAHDTDSIVERVGTAAAVLTNKTPLTQEALLKMPNLKYIGVLATGYNVVDIEAATTLGITVTNVPTYGTAAVAQMAIALLLELCHHVGEHSRAVKEGEWSKSLDWCFWKYPLVELAGKKMGIIGLGRIGKATARIAQALGMQVLAYDTSPDPTIVSDTLQYVALDELFAKSDVVVLHCALTENSQGIINETNIAKMKDGVFIINNSRGQLIVEEDLAVALKSGKVAGAAVDVVSTEPIKPDNPLLAAPNCIITPHLSWAPLEARKRLMDVAINNLQAYLAGNPINVVNQEVLFKD